MKTTNWSHISTFSRSNALYLSIRRMKLLKSSITPKNKNLIDSLERNERETKNNTRYKRMY